MHPCHWFNWKFVSVPAVSRDGTGPLPAPVLAAMGGSSAGEPAAIWETTKLRHPGDPADGTLVYVTDSLEITSLPAEQAGKAFAVLKFRAEAFSQMGPCVLNPQLFLTSDQSCSGERLWDWSM